MRRLWIVGESLPLSKDGANRIAKAWGKLPPTLVPMDPRHGVFPTLVMKPLFAAVFAAFQNHPGELPDLLREAEPVVRGDSEQRFNVFSPRITDKKENPDDHFEVDEQEIVKRIRAFNPEQDLWLIFGHQTCFGLLKWLIEGSAAKLHSRKQLEDYSISFVKRVFELFPKFAEKPPTSKSGRVGLLHRLCTEGAASTLLEKVLEKVISDLKQKAVHSTEWIVNFLRSTVPLLHNEAYQDRHAIGNAQAHFVQSAAREGGTRDLYWQVMGNAIAQRAFDRYVG